MSEQAKWKAGEGFRCAGSTIQGPWVEVGEEGKAKHIFVLQASTDAPWDQAVREARIIAAAPLMLKALRRFVDSVNRCGVSPELDAAWLEARAAIVAAEGESNGV